MRGIGPVALHASHASHLPHDSEVVAVPSGARPVPRPTPAIPEAVTSTRLLRRAPAALLAASLALVPAARAQGPAAMYDLVIRGGRVLDGTGNPWYRADVAITGDRIAAVGDLRSARGRREIDASGLYVAPGFIDTHSHAGGGLATPALSGAVPLPCAPICECLERPLAQPSLRPRSTATLRCSALPMRLKARGSAAESWWSASARACRRRFSHRRETIGPGRS